MKKIIIIILLVILLYIPIVVAREPVYNEITRDYRPSYNFTYDTFKFLPSFPQDFWIRKQLFDTQQIQAERLTEEYYLQPEILPGWSDWCDRIYGISEKNLTGVYGIAVYPSRFDVFNLEINDTVKLSALLHTTFGVEIYQGAKIVFKYNNSNLDVEFLGPTDNILLAPTYPEFDSNWCRIISFNITVKEYGKHTVEFWEEKPDPNIDETWKDYYKNSYTSGGSILGLQIPKMKIYLYAPTSIIESSPDKKSLEPNSFNVYPWFSILFLLFLIIIGGFYVRYKRRKTEKK